MSDDDTPKTPPGKALPGEPHTVKAGMFDAFLGHKGPNGELMIDGKPAMVTDLPDNDDEDD
ncbi:hypothetical protein [Phenylobacterium sp.]|uniref:hypothetical protein n=1 Tax=Phenylobacterium sp. TaxID=1871053 RepID=UPI00120C5FAC|nr:hypothetical protein [Phenylobacterium sp.]THD58834.1 MAG: hypothetical protein E8A49_17725 [Phenylobacterium sp.]